MTTTGTPSFDRRRLLKSAVLAGAAVAAAPYSKTFSVITHAAGLKTLRAAMQTNPPTLDPHKTTASATQQIAVHVFEPLVAFAGDYSQIVPVLAESWDVSSDDRVYTFRIRKGVRFHNGQPLRAQDVAASLERIVRQSAIKGYFESVDDIRVLDDYAVRIALKAPDELLSIMAIPITWQAIMPKEIVEAAGADELKIPNLIGTGPYMLAEWKPDVHVLLKKNPYYVPTGGAPSGFAGNKAALLDEIRFSPMKEPGARMAALQVGECQYAENLPISARSTLQQVQGIALHVVKPQWAPALEFNHVEAPTNAVKFRQAVLAALDMEVIMRTVAMNDATFYRLQPSRFYPEQKAWHSVAAQELYNQHDPAKAKRLLEEAGYDGSEIVFLSNRDYDWMYRATLAVVTQLSQVGIKVKLEFSDWPSQIGKALTRKGWHINQSGWSFSFDPIQLRASLLSGASYGYGYSDPRMDQALDAVMRHRPQAERKKILDTIQRLAYETVPNIRLGDLFGLEGTRTDVQGYEPWYVTPRFWNVQRG
ncbi:ABC transporter substrate-binding protein [Carboxydochorda subterranea]|uniref:ABC transporter substrate-binding protein n=1 Tax=Carboxydichorda subterranea TaxID=3109565 RepID=A0ABZ1BXF1_9FIRM|nr:ABC transporter substrate-binding protein [Limnochorda sp. L945t]WRP16768.1 ABC transporter substrate-binding protein [Limnochorda sp. L945t]